MSAPFLSHPLLRAGASGLILAVALAGCANPNRAAPGTRLSDMEKQYGAPAIRCPLPGGGLWVVWSQQPEGSYAWGADVDATGKVVHVREVLTLSSFSQMQSGWTPDQVRCAFGPPAKIGAVGLGDKHEVVWTYRYMQDVRWHMAMYVYMGPDGQRLTHYHSGPDERYQRSE